MTSWPRLIFIVALMSACSTPSATTADPPVDEPVEEEPEQQPTIEQVSYRFTPGTHEGRVTIAVKMEFRTDKPGASELVLPEPWANATDFHEGIVDLQPGDESVAITPGTDDLHLIVDHGATTAVTLRYQVLQIFDGDLITHRFHPIIDDEHFRVFGYGLFVRPALDRDEPLDIVLDWSAYDEAWEVASSHRQPGQQWTFHAPMLEVVDAIYLGGEFDRQTRPINGGELLIATRGEFPFSTREFADQTAAIIDAQRAVFALDDPADVLVVAYEAAPCCGFMGTVLGHGISLKLAMQSERGLTKPQFSGFLSHEAFHLYIGTILRVEPPYQRRVWFNEGFTNFYGSRLLLRQGLLSLQEYVSLRNEAIVAYELSPVQQATIDEVEEGFWSDSDLQQLPYRQGELLALYWDEMIRQASEGRHSLDDVMAGLFRRAAQEDMRFNQELLFAELLPLWPQAKEELTALLGGGPPVSLPDDVLGRCVVTTYKEAGLFAPGFDFEATAEAGTIQGLDPDGPAYRAGLREHHELVGYSANHPRGITSTDTVVTVIDEEGQEVEIRYLATDEPRQVLQLAVDEDRYAALGSEGCLAWLR